eukprot:TRINITY_DN2454_c0_g1_i1.p1 TRINITY_DN2454_c0_g1~~TRINITY_DN2454_c0_g1_i1.p1  ORF type:complete len:369 (+),score=126.89 TRINITY_DN2454_c0_g1_i1:191-1297(+)
MFSCREASRYVMESEQEEASCGGFRAAPHARAKTRVLADERDGVDGDLSLTQEFKALPKPPNSRKTATEVFGCAITPENTCKNRYPDVLPYEEHRVKLRSGSSDYINASYIRGRHAKSYISCQAPLPSTFADFWCMIWENQIPLVVMLTRFLEKRQIKAHCYWPQDLGCTEHFGGISLMLTSVRKLHNNRIVLRTFKMTHDETREMRNVAHIHYTEWPDFGVPSCSQGLRQVVRLIDMYNEQNPDKPVVVHCSAGIGRTGTLLAVHSFLSRHRGDNNVTVRQIVEDMRRHRMGMVQTKEQYKFIYQAIEDALREKDRMSSAEPQPDAGSPPTEEATAAAAAAAAAAKRSWRTRSSPAVRTSAEMAVTY